jgi:hypothetical protein
MISKLALATAIGVLVLAGSAAAQSPQTTQAAPLSCRDFQRDANGAWTPLIPMTLNGVAFDPGVAFPPGTLFGAMELATALNQWCSAVTPPRVGV